MRTTLTVSYIFSICQYWKNIQFSFFLTIIMTIIENKAIGIYVDYLCVTPAFSHRSTGHLPRRRWGGNPWHCHLLQAYRIKRAIQASVILLKKVIHTFCSPFLDVGNTKTPITVFTKWCIWKLNLKRGRWLCWVSYINDHWCWKPAGWALTQ